MGLWDEARFFYRLVRKIPVKTKSNNTPTEAPINPPFSEENLKDGIGPLFGGKRKVCKPAIRKQHPTRRLNIPITGVITQ